MSRGLIARFMLNCLWAGRIIAYGCHLKTNQMAGAV
jgi:hypothetical protein